MERAGRGRLPRSAEVAVLGQMRIRRSARINRVQAIQVRGRTLRSLQLPLRRRRERVRRQLLSNSGNSGDQPAGQVFGGGAIVGVVSTSKKTGYREFNHKKKYNEWQFIYDPGTDRGGLLMTPNQPTLQGFGSGTQNPSGPNTGGFGPPPPGTQNNPNPPPGVLETPNPPSNPSQQQ